MRVASNATTVIILENFTSLPTVQPKLSERDRIRMEFYQTYDLMTGIRIAATLGGFFTLMVLLVVYKSKYKSKADESLEAAITAAVAEEEELEAALNRRKYSYTVKERKQSLGNMSAPIYTRFSSVGGYDNLLNPSIRKYQRGAKGRISLPASDLSFRYINSTPTSISSQERRSPHFWKLYNQEEVNDLKEVDENEDEMKFVQITNQYQKCDLDSVPTVYSGKLVCYPKNAESKCSAKNSFNEHVDIKANIYY